MSPLKSRLEAIGGWPLIDSGAWKDEEFMWYGHTNSITMGDQIIKKYKRAYSEYTMGHQIIRYLIELLNYHLRIW